MTGAADEPDVAELQRLVEELDRAITDLQAYGETHDNPAIERTAVRLAGTASTLKQNVPGGLTEE